jgi:two-component system chemotaxis sensor kinase CheA
VSVTTNQRLLIVDDNPAIHDDFRKIFAPSGDSAELEDLEAMLLGSPSVTARPSVTFELASAFQGREALDLVIAAIADQRPFAVAFIDMRMPPGWDGLETIDRLWQVDPDLQIVICSAYSDHSWSDLLARFGVRESLLIVKKPFDSIEVVQCAHALTTKWTLARQVRAHVEELEATVASRTRELHEANAQVVREMQSSIERERAIQLVLDSMHDGLLVCELDGRVSPVRSRSVTSMFGEPSGAQPVWDYLSDSDPALAHTFELGWAQLAADVLPFEIAATQLPAELPRGARTYRLAYERVDRDGALAQIAVSIHDVTDELAIRRAQELADELASVLGGLLQDRHGFFAFLEDTDQLLHDLDGYDGPARQLHSLHTLKGNTATFGFRWFSAQCHALEDVVATEAVLGAERLDALRACWRQSLDLIRPFLGYRNSNEVTLSRDELAEQVARLRGAGVPGDLLDDLDRWYLEPVGPALERLAREAERIAAQQSKRVVIAMEGTRVRFADDRMRRLLPPLVHAVRNAIDHGLEVAADRVASGKSESGQLVLACAQTATELVLSVSDDGRGVSWDRVRDRALSLGLPAESRADLVEVLFGDRITMASAMTEVSGRGIGLGALRETCQALGGTVSVESEPGHGTRLTCVIPFAA